MSTNQKLGAVSISKLNPLGKQGYDNLKNLIEAWTKNSESFNPSKGIEELDKFESVLDINQYNSLQKAIENADFQGVNALLEDIFFEED